MPEFRVLTKANEIKLKEKGSLFNGLAFPVNSEEEANDILVNLKKKYYDATHHCFAYKLIDKSEHYSDDGEPSGTAGIRILNAISHFKLTNVLIVVVRYFGGTKLGVGLLGKTYYQCAYESLESASIKEMHLYKKFSIKHDFNFTGKLHHTLSKLKAIEINNRFKDSPIIDCKIRSERVNEFFAELDLENNFTVELTEFDETYLK